jgi:hypothetical protein
MGISRDASSRELARLSGPVGQDLPYSLPIGEPFQRLFGIGRTTQCQLIECGEVDSILVGAPGRDRTTTRGRRVIIVSSYLAYMERQRQRETAGEIGMASPNPRARRRQTTSTAGAAFAVEPPRANAQHQQQYRSSRRSS